MHLLSTLVSFREEQEGAEGAVEAENKISLFTGSEGLVVTFSMDAHFLFVALGLVAYV